MDVKSPNYVRERQAPVVATNPSSTRSNQNVQTQFITNPYQRSSQNSGHDVSANLSTRITISSQNYTRRD